MNIALLFATFFVLQFFIRTITVIRPFHASIFRFFLIGHFGVVWCSRSARSGCRGTLLCCVCSFGVCGQINPHVRVFVDGFVLMNAGMPKAHLLCTWKVFCMDWCVIGAAVCNRSVLDGSLEGSHHLQPCVED